MAIRTGLEGASFQVLTVSGEALSSPAQGSTQPAEAPQPTVTAPDADARRARVTGLAAYLESVGRLAAQAVNYGDVALGQELLAQAARVAVAMTLPSARAAADSVAPPGSAHVWEGPRVHDRAEADV